MDLEWLEWRCAELVGLLDGDLGAGNWSNEWVQPEAKYFLWTEQDEASSEENWKHVKYSTAPLNTATTLFTEMPHDLAEVGVHVSDEITMADLAIIDVLQGLLVHDAVFRQKDNQMLGLPLPQINFVGNGQALESSIRWRHHLMFADGVLLNWLYDNRRMGNLFADKTGVPLEMIPAYLWSLYPLTNTRLVWRGDGSEFVAEPMIHTRSHHHGEYGLWRLQSLLNTHYGRSLDFGVADRVPEIFKRAMDVWNGLCDLFELVLEDEINSNFTALGQWNSTFLGE